MTPGKKAIFAVCGFLLMALGFLSLVFGAIGIRFMFLGFLDLLPPLGTLLVHLGMLFGGIVIMYIGLTDWKEDDPQNDQ